MAGNVRHGLRRSSALLLVVVTIVAVGYGIQRLPGDWTLTTEQKGSLGAVHSSPEPVVTPVQFDRQGWVLPRVVSGGESAHHASQQVAAQTQILFEHALLLLQEGRYRQAVKALEMVITLAPWMPEAFVNLGFALYELNEMDAARGAFLRAIELNPGQGNAYYGLATTYEALGELDLALGAMRSYLHVAEGQEHFKAKARSAIWEWESALGRDNVSDGQPSAG